MSEKPEQARRGWKVSVLVLAAIIGLYVGGYFGLGSYDVSKDVDPSSGERYVFHRRVFPSETIRKAYHPLGYVEFSLRGGNALILTSRNEQSGVSVFEAH